MTDYEIDHRRMRAPNVRLASCLPDAFEPAVTVWDLRLSQPGLGRVAADVLHSLEHMLTVFMRAESERIVRVAPMGCQTGLYVITLGIADAPTLHRLLTAGLRRIGTADAVPLADGEQCGAPELHTLTGAQAAAAMVLAQADSWNRHTFASV